MNVLNVKKFWTRDTRDGGQQVGISFETADRLAEGFFTVDSGYCKQNPYEFRQTFFASFTHTNKPYAVADELLVKELYRADHSPVKDPHAGLREFMLSALPELMMLGYSCTGSYEYDGKKWEINPMKTTETLRLPDGFSL